MGWAGALNENVAIQADQPFRVRFEVARPAAPATGERFQLQYRRNGGGWSAVEAHDFPYPKAELELGFAKSEVGTIPKGWRVALGDAAGLAVTAERGERILRAQAEQEPLIGQYSPPWDLNKFTLATVVRIPAGNRSGVGLVFGDFAGRNYSGVLLDPAAGAIRVGVHRQDGGKGCTARSRVCRARSQHG